MNKIKFLSYLKGAVLPDNMSDHYSLLLALKDETQAVISIGVVKHCHYTVLMRWVSIGCSKI